MKLPTTVNLATEFDEILKIENLIGIYVELGYSFRTLNKDFLHSPIEVNQKHVKAKQLVSQKIKTEVVINPNLNLEFLMQNIKIALEYLFTDMVNKEQLRLYKLWNSETELFDIYFFIGLGSHQDEYSKPFRVQKTDFLYAESIVHQCLNKWETSLPTLDSTLNHVQWQTAKNFNDEQMIKNIVIKNLKSMFGRMNTVKNDVQVALFINKIPIKQFLRQRNQF